MTSASECREFAHESLCWAKTARSERESAIFLQKAHAWLLAASKLAGYQVNDTESVGSGNSARNGRGPTLHAIREPCTIVVRPARGSVAQPLRDRPRSISVKQKTGTARGQARAQTSPHFRHSVLCRLRRLVLAGLQRVPIAYFGFTGRSIHSPTYFPLPAF